MKLLLASLGTAVLAFGLAAPVLASQPLLSPADLDAARQAPAVRVIDIRPADAYAAQHIPGAVSAPYAQWRGPADNPGKLPPVAQLTDLVRHLGLDRDSHAVVVSSGADSTDFGASARVYWTLKYLGLDDLSVLNGGMKAWEDAGLPQDADTPAVQPTAFNAQLNENIIATTPQVAARVGQSGTRLVDARPLDFYLGKTKAPTAKVPGTIKGAVNLENSKWFKPGTSIFVSADEAKRIAAQSLPDQSSPDETISFCNTGDRKSVV